MAVTTHRQGENGYAGTVDTYIASDLPTTSFAGGLVIYVSWQSDGVRRNGLINWNLSGDPSNQLVSAASQAYNFNAVAGGGKNINIYRCLRPWTATATWNTYNGTNAWNTAGALGANTDYDNTVLGVITSPSANGAATFSFNDAGLTVIANWLNNVYPNYGFILIPPASFGNNQSVQLRSSEATTVSQRPGLTFTHTDAGYTSDFGLDTVGALPAGMVHLVGTQYGSYKVSALASGQGGKILSYTPVSAGYSVLSINALNNYRGTMRGRMKHRHSHVKTDYSLSWGFILWGYGSDTNLSGYIIGNWGRRLGLLRLANGAGQVSPLGVTPIYDLVWDGLEFELVFSGGTVTIRAKHWNMSDAIPGTWDWTYTDNTPLVNPGGTYFNGLINMAPEGGSRACDYVSMGIGTSTPLGTPTRLAAISHYNLTESSVVNLNVSRSYQFVANSGQVVNLWTQVGETLPSQVTAAYDSLTGRYRKDYTAANLNDLYVAGVVSSGALAQRTPIVKLYVSGDPEIVSFAASPNPFEIDTGTLVTLKATGDMAQQTAELHDTNTGNLLGLMTYAPNAAGGGRLEYNYQTSTALNRKVYAIVSQGGLSRRSADITLQAQVVSTPAPQPIMTSPLVGQLYSPNGVVPVEVVMDGEANAASTTLYRGSGTLVGSLTEVPGSNGMRFTGAFTLPTEQYPAPNSVASATFYAEATGQPTALYPAGKVKRSNRVTVYFRYPILTPVAGKEGVWEVYVWNNLRTTLKLYAISTGPVAAIKGDFVAEQSLGVTVSGSFRVTDNYSAQIETDDCVQVWRDGHPVIAALVSEAPDLTSRGAGLRSNEVQTLEGIALKDPMELINKSLTADYRYYDDIDLARIAYELCARNPDFHPALVLDESNFPNLGTIIGGFEGQPGGSLGEVLRQIASRVSGVEVYISPQWELCFNRLDAVAILPDDQCRVVKSKLSSQGDTATAVSLLITNTYSVDEGEWGPIELFINSKPVRYKAMPVTVRYRAPEYEKVRLWTFPQYKGNVPFLSSQAFTREIKKRGITINWSVENALVNYAAFPNRQAIYDGSEETGSGEVLGNPSVAGNYAYIYYRVPYSYLYPVFDCIGARITYKGKLQNTEELRVYVWIRHVLNLQDGRDVTVSGKYKLESTWDPETNIKERKTRTLILPMPWQAQDAIFVPPGSDEGEGEDQGASGYTEAWVRAWLRGSAPSGGQTVDTRETLELVEFIPAILDYASLTTSAKNLIVLSGKRPKQIEVKGLLDYRFRYAQMESDAATFGRIERSEVNMTSGARTVTYANGARGTLQTILYLDDPQLDENVNHVVNAIKAATAYIKYVQNASEIG